MTYIGDRDFLVEVQKGNVPGHSILHKFGRNSSVANAAWEVISSLGQTGLSVHAFHLTTATTIRIKAGGHVDDDAAGNGARAITVEGLDENGNAATEVIVTNGVDASSNTSTTFVRVHRAYVSSCGIYGGANVAAITIENSGGGTDLIQIPNAVGQSLFGGYTIPLGKTGYLLSATITVEAQKPANMILFTRESILDTSAPVKSKREQLFWTGIEGLVSLHRDSALTFAALTDVWWEAYGGGANTAVTVDFEILLVDD